MIGGKRFVRIAGAVPGTSLLPVPFAIAAIILVSLVATLTLDRMAGSGRITLYAWLSVGDVDDARAILGAILGAVSTVLALIFSVTLLVFSMAVSQFGPRLMPYFLRDRAMQLALGLFLGTFLHTLMAFLVTGRRGADVFVPQVTTIASIALVFASFCYLVVYNHRIALALQTNNVLARIVEDLYLCIGARSTPRIVDTNGASASPPDVEENVDAVRARCLAEGGVVLATTSGYLQMVDFVRLVKAAHRCGAVVCFAFRQGQFVIEGETFAHVLPASQADDVAATIRHAVEIGQHRTLEQDAEFAFAQLSEIAIRALSPAINDTYTGLSCIDWLGDALRMFGALPVSDGAWRTTEGKIRVLVPPLLFRRVVRAAFDLIRQAAMDSPAVCIRLLETYARLVPQLHDDEQRSAILVEVEAIREAVARMPDIGLDREAIDEAYRAAHDRLTAARAGGPAAIVTAPSRAAS
jgi:uncharacterized membrane protein